MCLPWRITRLSLTFPQYSSAMEAVAVDPAFFHRVEHRATLVVPSEGQGVPVINLSNPTETLVSEVGNACKDWGFFQVINHGVPLEVRRNLELVAKQFFALPKEEKNKVRRDDMHLQGYSDIEHTMNVRDWTEILDFNLRNPTVLPVSPEAGETRVMFMVNRWPQNPPNLRAAVEEYLKEIEKLAHKVLELISLSLGLSSGRLSSLYNDHASLFRLRYYPPCPIPDQILGIGSHTDGGALTVLAQDDIGGLEVKRATDGAWLQVKPIPNAYVINIGDMVQVWSNDKYKSVEHRAMVKSDKERLSMPLFFNPDHYVKVEPLQELINEQNPAKYRPYSVGHFLTSKYRSNFKKLDVGNIEISQFRINEE